MLLHKTLACGGMTAYRYVFLWNYIYAYVLLDKFTEIHVETHKWVYILYFKYSFMLSWQKHSSA